MSDMMKKNEAFDPLAIGLLGPTAVMARAQGFPQLIEEFRFRRRRCIGGRDATRLPGRSGSMSGYDFQRRSCPRHSSTPKHQACGKIPEYMQRADLDNHQKNDIYSNTATLRCQSLYNHYPNPWDRDYYSGNNICQSRHSCESGNPELDWMPDQVRHDIWYV
jgi:hypothetical protein